MQHTHARATAPGRVPADADVNRTVSRVLLAGLALAFAFMALGTVLAALHPGPLSPHATPVPALGAALGRGDPAGFLSLGLLILLATPALRVLVVFIEYLRRREWLFALISLVVLAVLGVSVVLGTTE